MFSTLYLPNFHLQAALHHQSNLLTTRPVALLEAASHEKDKARILQLTDTAQNHGVQPGMTASQALARSPHLHLLNRDPDAEQHAQNQLLDIASRFSPDFESTAPGIVTLDLLGNSHLPKYADQLAQKFLAAMRSRGFHDPRVGLAENPGLALLAARLAKQTKIIRAEKHEVQKFLAPLPLSTLNPSPDLTHILSLWGIHTIGDFTQLPLTDTAHRLGPEAVALHEAASGKTSRLLNLVRPPADFSHTADLEYEIESLDPLLFLFRRALETITARLSAAWLLAGHLHLRLSFQDQTQYQHTFHIPDPTRDINLLFQILHTHLENFTTPSPVTGFKLETIPTPANGCQFHLFESRLRDPNRFYDTLARLEALLGPDHVGTPQCLPPHPPHALTPKKIKEKTPPQPKPPPTRAHQR
ncbi:MAG: DNA polymerase Y family protein, partial [Verrucomicrobiota bacterium]